MQFHALAEIFPLLEGQAFDELVADVRANGVREAVWMYEGKILDGRNRWRAAQAAGVEAPTRAYEGSDPVAFVLSLNLRRRHLDESQRSIVAEKLATLTKGRPPENASREAISQDKAAQMLNVSRSSVQRARKVISTAAPEVVRAVERGEVRLNVAAQIAKAPAQEQVAAVKEGAAAVKSLQKKVQASRPTAKQTKAQTRVIGINNAARMLLDFRLVLEDRTVALTEKDLVGVLPNSLLDPKGRVMRFLASCSKLATKRIRDVERVRQAFLKKQRKADRALAAHTRKTARRVERVRRASIEKQKKADRALKAKARRAKKVVHRASSRSTRRSHQLAA